ncbi:MAG TPA: hypothetical protein VFW69_08680 [Mycobacterium sp.]|nr:hypothetical protein [Mycobacterium sp.]
MTDMQATELFDADFDFTDPDRMHHHGPAVEEFARLRRTPMKRRMTRFTRSRPMR